ncbi:MAG: hypothetical protein HUU25_03420 [Candidatus Sumerlaeia bacterium]|nr:hypothetical protein [Candidatus Sumerlaeia bacterium]
MLTVGQVAASPVHVGVGDEPAGHVSPLLFGQMLERTRANQGECGAEGAWSAVDGDWVPGFVQLVQELDPGVLRFPGGGEADRYDWRWGLDQAPGRLRGRLAQEDAPGLFTTHRVGTEEFLDLCRRVGAEPLLVVNIVEHRDASEEGAALAADWVEYCNAPGDGSNPRGGTDWARVRAANGHPEPHGVRLWELGNEVWIPDDEVTPGRYERLARLWAREMLAADPSIEFIGMGQDARWTRASVEGIGEGLRFVSLHSYSVNGARQGDLTAEDAWAAALAGPPPHFAEQASETWGEIERLGRSRGVRIAVTEWNFNLWFEGPGAPVYEPRMTLIGAATFLHELMRQGDRVGLAVQSLLVGDSWNLTAIRLDEDRHPRPWVTWHLMALARAVHGSTLLPVQVEHSPTVGLRTAVGNMEPREDIPVINAVATLSSSEVCVSVVNGAVSDSIDVEIVFPPSLVADSASVRLIQLGDERIDRTLEGGAHSVTLALPPRTVSFLCWPREQ